MGMTRVEGIPGAWINKDLMPPETTAEELARQEAVRGAIERLRDMVGATSIDFENAPVDCVRDMWVLAQEYIREND